MALHSFQREGILSKVTHARQVARRLEFSASPFSLKKGLPCPATENQNANHANLANPREATQIPFAQFALFAPIRVLNPSIEKQSA